MKKEIKTPLLDALKILYKNPSYQFHIPGHTRGKGVLAKFKKLIGEKALKIDTTDEFDNLGTLNPATGAIKEAEDLAAEAFGAEKTFFLLNGSTVGNLALALGITKRGQAIITNRNCHRSVMTGMLISGADLICITPEKLEDWGIWGSISAEKVEEAIKENPFVGAVWITSPTYEGVISDVKAISEVCKKYNVPLIVDEAHGSLWNFHEDLPIPALQLGADAVVQSLHKTGGSMSQSSMLHIAKNSLIDHQKVEKALKLLHTTSPSLILLASLDAARANLSSLQGHQMIQKTIENANYLREKIDSLTNIHLLKNTQKFEIDSTKIFIKANGLSGKNLEEILEKEFNIEIESASDIGALILVNLGNTRKDIDYLIKCLKKINEKEHNIDLKIELKKHMPMLTPKIKMNIREAFFMEKEIVTTKAAVGRLCGEIVAECPPGIAILLPGELITPAHLPYLRDYAKIEIIK